MYWHWYFSNSKWHHTEFYIGKRKAYMKRIERILSHFEQEAKEYDDIIIKLIPEYKKMVSILVDSINHESNDHFSVIDLGCGTGTLAKKIEESFPNADITCMDISEKMLKISKSKMNSDINIINDSFYEFVFPQKYDVIVSSLALHHLETDKDKEHFYQKIYSALSAGGIFLNLDIVTAPYDILQQKYLKHWKSFMLKNTSVSEVENKWLPNYYAEDKPISLIKHFQMLEHSGFNLIDCVYKYYNYAVYLTIKS